MRLLDDMESAVEDDEIEWRTGQLFAMVAEGLAAAGAVAVGRYAATPPARSLRLAHAEARRQSAKPRPPSRTA